MRKSTGAAGKYTFAGDAGAPLQATQDSLAPVMAGE